MNAHLAERETEPLERACSDRQKEFVQSQVQQAGRRSSFCPALAPVFPRALTGFRR